MRNLTKAVVFGLGVALLTTSAWAGSKSWDQVSISGTFAAGSVGYARNSSDSKQYIGCDLYATQGGLLGECFAMDSAGKSIWCYSYDKNIVQAIGSVNGDSLVQFSVNSDTTCSYVYIRNISFYAPKAQ
jgi:hypothetical protein